MYDATVLERPFTVSSSDAVWCGNEMLVRMVLRLGHIYNEIRRHATLLLNDGTHQMSVVGTASDLIACL